MHTEMILEAKKSAHELATLQWKFQNRTQRISITKCTHMLKHIYTRARTLKREKIDLPNR